ncbi:hypothetical protein LCGC14_0612760 [marine sediment metagenome]|uniref:Uncharacterized protein n=1 Tax=marine sediment metagenome TaxID=412755 RepID=A0A0F9RRG9_9ZZZZ
MAYTSTDLTNVEAAIVALATGSRKVEVTLAGKSITYAPVNIDKLRTLRSTIQTELDPTTFPLRTYAKQGGRGA